MGFAAEAAPERDNIYRMTFAGAQVALGNAQRATALLQSAAEIEMEAPEVVSAGSGAEVGRDGHERRRWPLPAHGRRRICARCG